MSINKHNIKRRLMIVVVLAMMIAVLAAGTAHAGTRALSDYNPCWPVASDPQCPNWP